MCSLIERVLGIGLQVEAELPADANADERAAFFAVITAGQRVIDTIGPFENIAQFEEPRLIAAYVDRVRLLGGHDTAITCSREYRYLLDRHIQHDGFAGLAR